MGMDEGLFHSVLFGCEVCRQLTVVAQSVQFVQVSQDDLNMLTELSQCHPISQIGQSFKAPFIDVPPVFDSTINCLRDKFLPNCTEICFGISCFTITVFPTKFSANSTMVVV